MREDVSHLLREVLRYLAAVALSLGGAAALANATDGYIRALGFGLLGIALFLVAGILVAFPIAAMFANPWGGMFYPEDRLKRAPPLYSLAETKVRKMQYEDAMALYEQIAEDYPEEVKPYVDMIDIAIVHLKDAKRAEQIYCRGIDRLHNRDDQDVLARMYRGIRSRIESGPEWGLSRTISMREDQDGG